MSVKKRILFSNVIMLLFLLALVMILSFYIMRVFLMTYIKNDVKSLKSPTTSESTISVYELQILFDGMIDMANESQYDIQSNSDFKIIDSYIMQTGSKAYILINGNPIYMRGGEDPNQLYAEAILLNDTVAQNKKTILYSDSDSFIYSTNVYLNSSGEEAEFLLYNDHIGTMEFKNENSRYWQDAANDINDAVRSITILGSIIIIIINFVLIVALSNSIMGPLNKLKDATEKISEGNLDFEIDFVGDDEITDVLQKFEEMREKLVESNEKQRAYEDDRKEMIAGISHDLRTPLTSIKGYVSGLIDGIADSPEKQEKYLKTIYNTASEMDKLVDDLFLFSKLDLDKIPFDFDHVEIGNYISQCCEEIRFNIEKKNVSLSFANLLPAPVYVQIDRDQFARVLINIAENSAKYKKNEIGSLYVFVSEVDGNVVIALRDDGEGIDSNLTGKIFDSFYRNDPARTNPVKGSGLGLSIAKQIVTSHGGKIWAESNIGEGLTIYISLPVDDMIIDERKEAQNGREENTDNRR